MPGSRRWCWRRFLWIWVLIAGFGATPAWAQFTPLTDHRPGVVLEGNWQSCLEDGEYGERVYDRYVNGRGLFEVHLGPRDEFAVFRGVQEEHRAHDSSGNLLGAAFHVRDLRTLRAKATWTVPSLGLNLSVVAAGGSREECESFWVRIEKMDASSRAWSRAPAVSASDAQAPF
jgi:hypothetical protein